MSRTTPVSGPSVSLFPFLAVLLCTMGSLLVLLVLFSRSAKRGETAEAAGERARMEQELELARDALVWRREQLEGVRERTAAELAKARMQLAGVEESSRALEDELETLERAAAALQSSGGSSGDEDAIRILEERLASSRESLEKALAERDTKPPAYAVVPYVGANGTHRRPLYIECCGDGVFLQPEGIRLSPGDFEGPPGPGNPLASALRAAREHIVATQGGTADPAAQPYPLLLVRPSGVMAYYEAREAIQSWGTDFGYQLVDEDWQLAFPPADPVLAQVERRAVEESRARLAWLADVRPSKPVKPVRHYRAAPTRGGVVADGGPSVLGDQSRWEWGNQEQAGRPGATPGSTPGGGGSGDGFGGGADGQARGRPVGGRPGTAGGADDGTGDAVLGGGPGAGGAGGPGLAHPARGGGRGDGSAAASLAAAGSAGTGASDGGATGTAGVMKNDGGAAGGAAGATGTAAAFSGGAAALRGGSAAGGQPGGGSTGTGQDGSGSAGGMPGPAMPGLVQTGGGVVQAGTARAAGGSIAQSRGKNWASLATYDRPIPLTRPIRLECAAHEFRLLDDAGGRVQTRIPVDGDTAAAVDPLIGAVHARVQGWGIAGDRMYWRPQLVLSETADGRSRREDLERLLADSGIDTRSGDRWNEVRPLPPVGRSTTFVSGR